MFVGLMVLMRMILEVGELFNEIASSLRKSMSTSVVACFGSRR